MLSVARMGQGKSKADLGFCRLLREFGAIQVRLPPSRWVLAAPSSPHHPLSEELCSVNSFCGFFPSASRLVIDQWPVCKNALGCARLAQHCLLDLISGQHRLKAWPAMQCSYWMPALYRKLDDRQSCAVSLMSLWKLKDVENAGQCCNNSTAFCKTGYASLFGVKNIELNIEICSPQSSK